jgi:acetyl-CoA carboxylase carboxyl transferase subunit alpha
VISPEGCASILWKSAEKSADAAEAMGITAQKLHELGLVDEVVPEPLGGAHRNYDAMAATLRKRLAQHLAQLGDLPREQLLVQRYERLVGYGDFRDG